VDSVSGECPIKSVDHNFLPFWLFQCLVDVTADRGAALIRGIKNNAAYYAK
jgi:hypothetical protein